MGCAELHWRSVTTKTTIPHSCCAHVVVADERYSDRCRYASKVALLSLARMESKMRQTTRHHQNRGSKKEEDNDTDGIKLVQCKERQHLDSAEYPCNLTGATEPNDLGGRLLQQQNEIHQTSC